jgi:hypothetical protein
MRVIYRLTYATEAEAAEYRSASVLTGLRSDLDHLRNDPLAREQIRGIRGYDHVHLSQTDHRSPLVQWWGRASSGYHYPLGKVMRIVR